MTPPLPSPRAAAAALLLALCGAFAAAQPPAAPPAPPDDKDKPKAATPAEQRAVDAFAGGKLDDALAALQDAAKDNKVICPKATLSRWLVQAQKGPEARQLLERAVVESPKHPEVFLTNALFALNEGRTTDALLNAERVLELANGSTAAWDADQRKNFEREARFVQAAGYERRADWAAAATTLEEVRKANPTNAQVLYRLAKAEFNRDQLDAAVRHLQTGFAANKALDPPELVVAQFWMQKPIVAEDQKDAEKKVAENRAKAEAAFEAAQKAYDPARAGADKEARERSARVTRAYAGWLLEQGKEKVSRAELLVNEAVKLDPDNRDTKALNGLLARYTKNFPKAAELFDDVLRNSPKSAFAMGNLALALCESTALADKKRALDLAELYVSQNPQNADAYAVQAYVLYRSKPPQVQAAAASLGKALQGGQLGLDTAYYAALILNDQGKLEEAKKFLDSAVKSPAGSFVYRDEATKLLAEIDKKLAALPPPKTPSPKTP